ncbi:MAG: DUF4249 domain-containing protein [Bacteroidales bacterium]|nr:DUF4249 domain-containing protein [Bacteroidales bacterium]
MPKNISYTSPASLICWLVFLVSCTSELSFEFNDADKKHVISCIYKADDKLNVYAHYSEGFATKDASVAKGLKMQLSQAESDLIEAELYKDSLYTFGYTFIEDIADINITDTVSGKQFSGSLQRMPYVYLSSAVCYRNNTIYDYDYGSWFTKYEIELQDEPDTDNYYEIVLLDAKGYQVETIVNSPVFSKNSHDFNVPILFSDENFRNNSLKLPIYANGECKIACLRNVSKSYYDYYKSLTAHIDSQNVLIDDDTPLDLFFSPYPVELYSNVDGALGVFMSYSESLISFTISR